jgi:hypothetical protein
MRGDGHNREGTQTLWNWLSLAVLVALGIVWAPEPTAPGGGPVPAAAAAGPASHLASAPSTRTR